jgi:23S rRNA (uridine2552-2'-O)-methyltransferase
MEPIPGARFVRGDFMDTETQATIRHLLHGSEADVVLSDMSPSTTGDKGLNHDRIMALAEEGAVVAKTLLRNGGVFVCKLFNGEGEREFREFLRSDFLKVKACKPNASRKASPEIYYVATGYVPKHMQGESAGNVVQPSNELLQSVETIVDEYSLLRRPRAASPAVS